MSDVARFDVPPLATKSGPPTGSGSTVATPFDDPQNNTPQAPAPSIRANKVSSSGEFLWVFKVGRAVGGAKRIAAWLENLEIEVWTSPLT